MRAARARTAADRLTRPSAPAATAPEGLKSPFNPPNFERPVEDPKQRSDDGPKKPLTPGDLEILETLAARIPNAATIGMPGGKTLLLIGKTRLQVGDAFTVTNPANNQDYELQLVAVTSTTFTLRYRDHEVTRPTRTAK